MLVEIKDLDEFKIQVRKNMKKELLNPDTNFNFKGGLITGRNNLFLRDGRVVFERISETKINARFEARASWLSYSFYLMIVALANLIFFLIGKDVLMFAIACNIIVFFNFAFYWPSLIHDFGIRILSAEK